MRLLKANKNAKNKRLGMKYKRIGENKEMKKTKKQLLKDFQVEITDKSGNKNTCMVEVFLETLLQFL